MSESPTGGEAIRYAVIIPCYGHSGFVAEAALGAIEQENADDLAVVMINDGCKFRQTDVVGEMLAAQYPGKFHYLRGANRGLGAARNAAIEYAMGNFRNLQFVFFLDADNRLEPGFLDRSKKALAAHGPLDVLYFSMMNFGATWYGDNSGAYSLAEHFLRNPIDAGCWIAAGIFREGHRFYTDKRQGYEDWQLSATLGAKGKRLVHTGNPGFHYRRRAESMVTGTLAAEAEVMGAIRGDLRAHLTHVRLIEDEHGIYPRYLVWDGDALEAAALTDLNELERVPRLGLASAAGRMVACSLDARRVHSPPYNLAARRGAVETLRAAKLDVSLLCEIERAIDAKKLVCVRFAFGEEGHYGIEGYARGPSESLPPADILACHLNVLLDLARSPERGSAFLEALARNTAPEAAVLLRVRLPKPRAPGNGDAGVKPQSILASIVAALRGVIDREPMKKRFEYKEIGLVDRRVSEQTLRRVLRCGTVVPRLKREVNRKRVGLLAPLPITQPVEDTLLAAIRGGFAADCGLRLYVAGATQARVSAELFAAVDDIVFLGGLELAKKVLPRRFFGAAVANPDFVPGMAEFMGMFSDVDIVLTVADSQLQPILRELRARGKETIGAVEPRADWSKPELLHGQYALLAYEHVYDRILVPSEDEAQWFAAHGVPDGKLVLLSSEH